MTENAKKPAAQNIIQDPPEYSTESANNPKQGSDWLGGPQNGSETTSSNPDVSPETEEDQDLRGQLKWNEQRNG